MCFGSCRQRSRGAIAVQNFCSIVGGHRFTAGKILPETDHSTEDCNTVRAAAENCVNDTAEHRRAKPGQALDHYEPGLDGLRACAVAAVLAYHTDMSWAKGGFLGISLFFTLSGFLITSILLRMHESTGTISLRTFWTRRYRRLLPAAYLTLAGVVVFGATVATRQQLKNLPGAVTSAVFQVANWFFMFADQSYVNLFTAPSPVQHFWSLAIEEQFYVVMPIVLILLLRRVRSMRSVAAVFASAAAASALLMVALYERGASLDRLYYGTDTRVAEILVGCVAAVVLYKRPLGGLSTSARRLWAGAGLAAFALTIASWSVVGITSPMLWRGGFLVYALLSLVLILSVLHHVGPVASLVRTRPFAAVGRISYGLYLFHWPIYLWLDADRTGLAPWPLFAVRVAVTAVVAELSFHLLEMPIRDRRVRMTPTRVRSLAAAAVVVIILGAVVVSERNVTSNLAGLDRGVSAAPTLATRHALNVLVIPESLTTPTMKGLEAYAAKNADLAMTVAHPLACSASVGAGNARVCKNWLSEWPLLIRRVDPDVVLVQVTQWDPGSLKVATGATDSAGQTRALHAVLLNGLRLLRARGAPIVWSPDQLTAHNLLDVESRPFFSTMDALTASAAVLRAEEAGDASLIVDQLRAVRRRSSTDLTRVLVVGDSVSRTLGYGLEKWASAGNRVVVWSVAVGACGIADEGKVVELGRVVPTEQRCHDVKKGWVSQIQQFTPDLVIVLSSIWDNQQRQLPTWPSMLVPGDPAFDDYLVRAYIGAYDIFAAHGAKVLWMKSPCAQPGFGPWPVDDRGNAWSVARIRHVNDVILPRVAKARPALRFFDLFGIVCADGKFRNEIGNVKNFRPDGIHFSPEGSIWLADHYGQQMLDAGLR